MATAESDQVFARTADLRRQIADLAAELTPAQLARQSLCGAWTVRDVLGHLVVPLTISMPQFAVAMLRARGDFHVANDRLARQSADRLGARLPQVLRERAGRRFIPPGGTPYFQLADLLVHSQDIRRPLGVAHTYAVADLRDVLTLLVQPASGRGFIPRSRAAGLQFRAIDLPDGSGPVVLGAGPSVEGPAEAIILALTGRRVALADLSGPGVDLLAARLPHG